ncbi:VIT1/CCC1 transporter family protein [Bacteroidota bacterium]
MDEKTRKSILEAQKNELTEYHIYNNLAASTKDEHNKKILKHIAKDELRHHNFWKTHTNQKVQPNRFKIWMYKWIARILGLTFGLKLMENGEDLAQSNYDKIAKVIPEVKRIEKDENEHERNLINMINEKKLDYAGSMVLGLNDALVELTGAIAGLTLAFQNIRLVGIASLVTGIAASLSMAASEYLSTKTEGDDKNPFHASFYTGIAYIFTVAFLVIPYFVLDNIFVALATTLGIAVLIILLFTYYISVAKDYNFKKRFWEMTLISLGVAAISFLIGLAIRHFLNIEI